MPDPNEPPRQFDQWTWQRQVAWHHQQIRHHLSAAAKIILGIENEEPDVTVAQNLMGPGSNRPIVPATLGELTIGIDFAAKAGQVVVVDNSTGMIVPARTSEPIKGINKVIEHTHPMNESCSVNCPGNAYRHKGPALHRYADPRLDLRGEKCPIHCQNKTLHYHTGGLIHFPRPGEHVMFPDGKCYILADDNNLSKIECREHISEKEKREWIDRKVREEFHPGSTGNPTEAG